MGYFKDEPNITSGTPEVDSLFERLGDICLKHIMLSSDAYIRMIELNMQGFKRLHRHLGKEFHDMYLDLQRESLEKFNKPIPSRGEFKPYKPKDLQEHLENWTMVLEEDLKEVNFVIKTIFNECGYIPCVAKEIQYILYKNIIKNERAIQKFEDCNWDNIILYKHDHYLHTKMKEIESKD